MWLTSLSALHRALNPVFPSFSPAFCLWFASSFPPFFPLFLSLLVFFFALHPHHPVFSTISASFSSFCLVHFVLSSFLYLFFGLSLFHSPRRLVPLIEQPPLNRLTLQSLNNNLIPSIPPSVFLSEGLPVHLTTLFQAPIHGAQITQGAVMTAHLLINCMCNC